LARSEEDQFALLVGEHQAAVFRTLARMLGRSDHLEDLAQEVFLRLWRGLDHFRGEAQIKTYLYRIITHVAIDERKRRARLIAMAVSIDDPEIGLAHQLVSSEPGADETVSLAELNAGLSAAFTELKDIERNALVLYHQEELSYQEVAAVLGVPLNTVRTHLHRGRERLRTALKERISDGL
jgi:RNA polymerase sigma-70 factor, ECF subfamily